MDPAAGLMIESEFSLWRQKWRRHQGTTASTAASSCDGDSEGDPDTDVNVGVVPPTVLEVLDECDAAMFPNINNQLNILAALPISVATAERSFSTLRRLKTWLHANMNQERLAGLALLHIHLDIECCVDKVIERYAKSGSRKLEFVL